MIYEKILSLYRIGKKHLLIYELTTTQFLAAGQISNSYLKNFIKLDINFNFLFNYLK